MSVRVNTLSEKDRIYAQLDEARRQLKACAKRRAEQRRELHSLRKRTTAKEAAVQRREAQEYRKALSQVVYEIENADADADRCKAIAQDALALRGLKAWQREQVEKARS